MSRYVRPESLDELFGVLRADPHARLLAGGTDLVVRLRKSGRMPGTIVDLKRMADLPDSIALHDGSVRIGARAVIADIAADPSIRTHFPALVEAALVVGSVQIRNRATIAGNICNASPAADTVPALLALDASVKVIGSSGARNIPIGQFIAGPGRTALAPGEVVHSIDLPVPTEPTGSAFSRLTRRHGVDLAIVSVCCVARESGAVRFSFGAVGPRPFSVDTHRDAPLDALVARAAPISDLRASEEYRLAMIPVLAGRARRTALDRLRQQQAAG